MAEVTIVFGFFPSDPLVADTERRKEEVRRSGLVFISCVHLNFQKRKASTSAVEEIELYCICRKPNYGFMMYVSFRRLCLPEQLM